MAKRSLKSKETRNELQLPAILCQYACQCLMLHPTSLPQEQAAKISMVSEVKIQVFITECGSTLYVGLAHSVSPTNTNFRLTFLLI